MNTASNKAFVGLYHEHCYLVVVGRSLLKEAIFSGGEHEKTFD